jgi:hypothetical protein
MYEQFTGRVVARKALSKFWQSSTLALLVLAGTISVTEAAEWRIEPVLRVAGDFDDNPFLSIRTDADENVSGTIIEGVADISYAAERTDFSITPRLRSRTYDSSEDLDSDDQFLRMNFTTRTQSTDFRFRSDYSRESTRTAERADTDFDVEDPSEIPEDDSGRVGIRDRRERMVIQPSILYHISDVSALNARMDYYNVDYDEAFAGLLNDYTNNRLTLSYSRAFSPRNTAILSASYRTFETEASTETTDGVGFTVGFDRRFTETTRLRAMVGLEDTELVGASNEISWVADVSLSRQLETTMLLAQYRRSVSASGVGQLGSRDSVNLNFTRDLNDTISAGLGARVYVTRAVNTTAQNFDDHDYVQLRSQFIWNLSEVFSIEANYRYTFLDRESLGESSNSNQVTIWFNYMPRPMIRSR